jgi:hypothetical protein
MPLAYEEVVDFIASGPSSSSVADYSASEETKAHVADLIQRQKTDGLTIEETKELNRYLDLEHVMRLAKARARLLLQNEST